MNYKGRTIYYDKKGYPIIWVGGKNIKLHIFAWEEVNGEKPKGYQLHHKDFDKKNYAIENLELVTQSEHFRIHVGWVKKNGKWIEKPCNGCNKVLPLKEFYYRRTVDNYTALCKKCHIEKVKQLNSLTSLRGLAVSVWG